MGKDKIPTPCSANAFSLNVSQGGASPHFFNKICKSPIEQKVLEYVYLYPDGINLSFLYSQLFSWTNPKPKSNNPQYMELYRAVEKLKPFLIKKREKDSIWLYPKWSKFRLLEVDLKKELYNSNHYIEGDPNVKPPKNKKGTYISELKFEGKQIIRENSMLSPGNNEDLISFFDEYNEETNERYLAFEHKSPSPGNPKYLFIPYETRFNSNPKRKYLWKRYFSTWDNADKQHSKGVFLTLTTDPKQFPNLETAIKHINIAWNRFISWTQKRIGFRPDYLRVLEFTKSGLPHLHIILFGTDWIAPKNEITEFWSRTGQGKINYLYPITRHKERNIWFWKNPKGRPKNTKRRPKGYLKKELSKLFNEKHELALYWITQRRFFSESKNLREKPELTPLEKLKKELIQSPEWKFIGSCYKFEIEDITKGKLYRKVDKPPPPSDDLEQILKAEKE